MNLKKWALALLLLTVTQETQSLIIGSDVAVSVESHVQFPEIDLLFDNIIRAFAWMKNGFSLEDSDTVLEFQSTFPVSGTVDLSGGELTLSQDLIFKNVTTLNGLGTILGQGHIVEFCSSISELPADTQSFDDTDIFFNGNLGINSTITFSGNCLLSGNRNKLDVSGGSIIVDSNSTLHIKNCDLAGIQDGKIVCTDDSSSLILDNVSWAQSNNFTFDTGALSICDHVTFSGTGTFVLSSQLTTTVADGATWKFTDNLIFRTGRHPTNGNEPFYFETVNSILYLDNIAFECFNTGIQLTNGTIIFNRDVMLDFLGTTTQTGAILGNGNSDNDIRALLNPGTTVDHRSGYWVYNNGQKDRLQANSVSAKLIRRDDSQIYVLKDLELQRTTVDIDSVQVMPIEVASGALLSYNSSVVRLPDVELDIKANQLSSFVYQLDGDDFIFFTRGTLPLGVVITGAGNVIKGNGSVSGPIIFSNYLAQLTLGINGQLQNYVNLANGMLLLDASLLLNKDGIINGPGIVDLSNYTIRLSRTVETWPTSISWLSSQGNILLDGFLSLLDTWTLQGELTINGNGNILDLSNGGSLLVGDGAHLMLKDIQINGVHDTNISCVSDSSKITLFNSTWVLDNDYSFTKGALIFEQENHFIGDHNFSYETDQTSTISTESSLVCTGDLVFKVGRHSAMASNEPLVFTDDTSRLMLDKATLNVQQYGYQLTKGMLVINRSNAFEIQSTHTGNGLVLGNGNVDDDILIQLNPGCQLNLNTGHIVYNLGDFQTGFISQSQTAQVNRGSAFRAHYVKNAEISNTTLTLTPPALFTRDSGVDVLLTNVIAKTPVGQFGVTGRHVSTTEIALDGGDKLEVQGGQFPSSLSVSGISNTIAGGGSVNGTITLENQTTQLISALTGEYLKSILLNNGTFVLAGTNKLGNGITITGPGFIYLGTQTIKFGNTSTTWATPLLWQGTGGTIGLNAFTTLQSTWTVSGDVSIDGGGFALNLSDDAEIVLAANTKLKLENIKIKNLSGTKIRCLNDNSVIVLNNVTIEQDDDYHFMQGAICFKEEVRIKGSNHIFGYETSKTSTIHTESYLMIDRLSTFSYDPSNASTGLIEFEDDSASLVLNNASLNAPSGISFIRGSMGIMSHSMIITDTTNGITIGNETASDDFEVTIDAGAILEIVGSFKYKNNQNDLVRTINSVSHLAIADDSRCEIFKTMVINPGIVEFYDNTVLARAVDADIIGSVRILGGVAYENF